LELQSPLKVLLFYIDEQDKQDKKGAKSCSSCLSMYDFFRLLTRAVPQ